jgi:ubiquitin-protein ligase
MTLPCLKRAQRELNEMTKYPSNIWTARPGGGYDLMKWEATIHNLDCPRHKGKKYRLLIEIPKDYPIVPPNIRFIDRVRSENVYPDGEICLDILKENWSPAFTIGTLLLSIASVLTDPPITGLDHKIPTIDEMVQHNITSIPVRSSAPIDRQRLRQRDS